MAITYSKPTMITGYCCLKSLWLHFDAMQNTIFKHGDSALKNLNTLKYVQFFIKSFG